MTVSDDENNTGPSSFMQASPLSEAYWFLVHMILFIDYYKQKQQNAQ